MWTDVIFICSVVYRYREANACVRVDGELSDAFTVGVGVKQGCVMSPWLLNIFMDECMSA